MSSFKCPGLPLSEAKEWAAEIDQMDNEAFASLRGQWEAYTVDEINQNLRPLREACVEAFKRAGGTTLPSRSMYPVDVEVGLAAYNCLNELGFTIVDAANDDIWRYLTVKVIPDLTYMRYPDPDMQAKEAGCRINKKRFFSHTRRIWIKTLWWYVHLSWQGDTESTRAVIEGNGSNIISHFIETPGRGYRVDLYRQLMKMYSEQPEKKDKLFRSIAKLNGAECRNVEPALMKGGVEEYCHILFKKINAHEGNNDKLG